MLKDDQIPDDLLVLSCEEDYDKCLPFLEKGWFKYFLIWFLASKV